MNVSFVLIAPAVPGNIGASARAIKTMGFNQLSLVNPCEYIGNEAQWRAHGSFDILENAKKFSDLDSATSNYDLIIGTTANTKRSAREDFVPIEQLSTLITSKKHHIENVAIVFGCEESGMSNEDLRKCDIVSTIPLKTTFPSLNLSQAVMLYAYELSKLESLLSVDTIDAEKPKTDPSEDLSFKKLKDRIRSLLINIGMSSDSNIFNRIMERVMFLKSCDINLLHSILTKLEAKVNKTDI